MSLVDIKSLLEIPHLISTPYVAGAVGTMDATGERLGNVLFAGKGGTVKNIWFRTGTVTKANNLKISLQGVDSNGVPDGTILPTATGNKAYTTATFLDTNNSVWLGPFQLTENCSITQGQQFSVVFEWSSYVDGNIQISGSNSIRTLYNQYTVTDVTATPGTWAKGTVALYCATLEFDDGTFMPLNAGTGYPDGPSVSSGTNPDEVGNYLKFVFPFRAVGFWIYGDFDYDTTLSLLNASNTTLANAVLTAACRQGTSYDFHVVMFDSDPAASVTIAKDTYYRLIITPGASAVYPRRFTVPEADAMSAFDLGADCVGTKRVDGGDWTQVNTERWLIGLIGDRLDDGSGGAGGLLTHPGMAGGMRG